MDGRKIGTKERIGAKRFKSKIDEHTEIFDGSSIRTKNFRT